MRVSISYSVELDEVPEKVSELAIKEVSLIKKEVVPMLDEALENLAMTDINRIALATDAFDRIKADLEEVNAKLTDYSNILKGFLSAKVQLAKQAEEQYAPPQAPEPTTPEVDNEQQPS